MTCFKRLSKTHQEALYPPNILRYGLPIQNAINAPVRAGNGLNGTRRFSYVHAARLRKSSTFQDCLIQKPRRLVLGE
jgi:hypothetical protein